MGYKMLKGEAMIAGQSLDVRVVTPDCPKRKEQLASGRPFMELYRCICYDNAACKYLLAFEVIDDIGCVKCMAPGAEDSEEFAELSRSMDESSERFEARRERHMASLEGLAK